MSVSILSKGPIFDLSSSNEKGSLSIGEILQQQQQQKQPIPSPPISNIMGTSPSFSLPSPSSAMNGSTFGLSASSTPRETSSLDQITIQPLVDLKKQSPSQAAHGGKSSKTIHMIVTSLDISAHVHFSGPSLNDLVTAKSAEFAAQDVAPALDLEYLSLSTNQTREIKSHESFALPAGSSSSSSADPFAVQTSSCGSSSTDPFTASKGRGGSSFTDPFTAPSGSDPFAVSTGSSGSSSTDPFAVPFDSGGSISSENNGLAWSDVDPFASGPALASTSESSTTPKQGLYSHLTRTFMPNFL